MACLASLVFTGFLIWVAYRKGRERYLLIPYLSKNVILIIAAFLSIILYWSPKSNRREISQEEFDAALWISIVFCMAFPIYAFVIVVGYLIELTERDAIAKKLFIAAKNVKSKGKLTSKPKKKDQKAKSKGQLKSQTKKKDKSRKDKAKRKMSFKTKPKKKVQHQPSKAKAKKNLKTTPKKNAKFQPENDKVKDT